METLVGKKESTEWLLAGRDADRLSWSTAGTPGGLLLSPECGGKVRSHQPPPTLTKKIPRRDASQ